MVRISGLRPDRALQRPAGLRAHRQCLRRALLSRRLSRPGAGDARLRHAPRLHVRPATARSASLFALRVRDMTGRGQVVDIGLYESIFRILDELAPAYHYKRLRARAHGARHRQRRAAQPLSHAGRQVDRDRLHQRQDLRAPGGAAGRARARRRRQVGHGRGPSARPSASVDAWVTRWTERCIRSEALIARCNAVEVPCGPVNSIDDIFADPQYKARENMHVLRGPARRRDRHAERGAAALGDAGPHRAWLGPALGEQHGRHPGRLLDLAGRADRRCGTRASSERRAVRAAMADFEAMLTPDRPRGARPRTLGTARRVRQPPRTARHRRPELHERPARSGRQRRQLSARLRRGRVRGAG